MGRESTEGKCAGGGRGGRPWRMPTNIHQQSLLNVKGSHWEARDVSLSDRHQCGNRETEKLGFLQPPIPAEQDKVKTAEKARLLRSAVTDNSCCYRKGERAPDKVWKATGAKASTATHPPSFKCPVQDTPTNSKMSNKTGTSIASIQRWGGMGGSWQRKSSRTPPTEKENLLEQWCHKTDWKLWPNTMN